MKKTFLVIATAFALIAPQRLQAQLTWDPDGNQASDGGTGTWDLVTANWDDDGGAPNTTWVNGSSAVFGDAGSNYVVDVADSGVTVGDLTVEPGTGTVTFRAITDNIGLITIAPGGATWDTGGRELEILGNNNADDTRLSVSSNDTLAVVGGGIFDAGEKQQGANWVAAGATVDFQEPMTIRGNANNLGQFATIRLADGTTYIHERNANQTYGIPDWDLGTGTVTFQNRWPNNGNITLNGNISGSGTMVIACNPTRFVKPNNPANDFTGKYIVGSDTIAGAELQVTAGDLAFGPVPASVVPDYITLKNNGELKMGNPTNFIHANRGITLENGGVVICNSSPVDYGGTITGTGPFQVGRQQGSDGNVFVLNSDTSDYTGGTRIWQGRLQLGADNALPTNGVLTLGGKGASRFYMNGYDQEIAGLATAASNTRSIDNATTNESILTITVAEDEIYSYGADFNDRFGGSTNGNISLVKQGAGTQNLTKGNIANLHGSITVSEGTLAVHAQTNSEALFVDDGATLILRSAGVGTTAETVTLGQAGTVTLGLDYGTLTSGNPAVGAIRVTDTDGFDPGATNILVNIDGAGFEVGQFPVIQYAGTALANIDNFTLGDLPDSINATLVNNPGSQSIDLQVTEAVRVLTWSGDFGLGAFEAADWDESQANWTLPNGAFGVYTNFYPALGFGDGVVFDSSAAFDGFSFEVVLTTDLTPNSVLVNNANSGFASNYVFSGSGKITGSASLTKSGAGTLIVANTGGNDYTGGTFINSGTFQWGVADALPTDAVLTVGSPNNSVNVELRGFDQTLGGLASGGSGGGFRLMYNGSTTAATLTLNVADTNEYLYGHTLGRSGNTNDNNFALVKTGTGTQGILTSFYTGTTTIDGGTLLFRGGAAQATGDVVVNTGGTLGGAGTVGGAITVNNGGSLTPAVGIGTLNANSNVTFAAGATFAIELDSSVPGADTLVVTNGVVTLDAGAILDLTDVAATQAVLSAGTTLTLIDYSGAGSLSGTFAGLNEGDSVTVGGNTFEISYTGGAGSSITLTVPAGDAYSTWAAGFPGITGGFGDDGDGDGVINGLEWYHYDSDPTLNEGSLGSSTDALVNSGSGVFAFTHRRPVDRAGVTEHYEWATAVDGPWNASGASDGSITVDLTVGTPTPDADPDYESVTVTVTPTPATATEIFARLRLEMP